MNIYKKMVRPLLFLFPPEAAHSITLTLLKLSYYLKLTPLFFKTYKAPKSIMGLHFPNAVGLAAGLDKNGEYILPLSSLGFGFIEIGTVTPRQQPGNSKPRLFRLPQQQALINRLGFNNKGCVYLVERLKAINFSGVLGVNIGKNADTPIDNAVDDYVTAFRQVAVFASYVTINISSPNTKELRDLQLAKFLPGLLRALKHEQSLQERYVPLVVKIAPDISNIELQTMAEIFLQEKIDGVIATNTTTMRPDLENVKYANEQGGLSGKPLTVRATEIIKLLKTLLQDKIPIIASGGIVSVEDAKTKMAAGASLIQLYTGLIYNGPQLVAECAKVL